MIKGINLIPDDLKSRWRLRKVRKALIAAAAVYLVFLGAVFTSQRAGISEKKAELASLRAELDSLASSGSRHMEFAMSLKRIKAAEAELNGRLSAASGLSGKRIAWSSVLKKLSHDIPGGVWLRSISTADADGGSKRLKMLGSASTNKGIADFIFTLENSGYFDDVKLSYTQKKDYGKDFVFEFEIYMDLKDTGEVMHEW